MKKRITERWHPLNGTEEQNEAADALIIRYTTDRGTPAALIYKGKSNKPYINYTYQSEESREKHLAREIEMLTSMNDQARQYRAHEAAKIQEVMSKIKPGTILYTTWGYEQTNVTFLEVIKVHTASSSATVREIESNRIEEGALSMSGRAYPRPGQYKNEPAKRVQVRKFHLYDRDGIGCSWYG